MYGRVYVSSRLYAEAVMGSLDPEKGRKALDEAETGASQCKPVDVSIRCRLAVRALAIELGGGQAQSGDR